MTIANMGAELTLTTSVFPSDDVTRSFLTRLNRGGDWRPVTPDEDAEYDDQIELDLGSMGPLIALPGSPDRVVPIEEVAGTPVDQVMVGSCTNGSWHDMSSVTGVLRGRRVHSSISFVLFPGSHRILETMAREGLLADLLAAGALVSESTCGSCAGIGHVPAAGTRSLRAFNRNFPGRSGVKGDEVYLCSSLVAAASALTGTITDPRTLGTPPDVQLPPRFAAPEAGFVAPDRGRQVLRGGEGGGARDHRRRRDPWSGLLARGGRRRPDAPRDSRRDREVVRAHPPGQPHQLGHRPADLRRPGRLRHDRA